MALNIVNAVEFTSKISFEHNSNFTAKIARWLIKSFSESLEVKEKIIVYLEKENLQFYIATDSEAPLKVVLKGLLKRTQPQDIANTFSSEGPTVRKVTQNQTRNDVRMLLHFFLHLSFVEKSQKIFKLLILYKIKV